MKDPFTRTYDAIVDAFQKRGVRVVSFNSTRDPVKDQLTEADFPEIQVRPTGMSARLGSSSSSTSVTRTYDIGINTGDQRVGYLLHPTEWRVLRILHELKYDELDALEFVRDVLVDGNSTGLSDPANRGIEGWSSLFSVTVIMVFDRADMAWKQEAAA